MFYWDSSNNAADFYSFPVRHIEDNWTNFPINKIGLHKMTTLTGGNDLTTLSKFLIEGKGINTTPNEAIRNSDGSMSTSLDVSQKSSYIMGHKCVYDYDTKHCSKMQGKTLHGSMKGSIKYNDNGTYRVIGNEGAFGLIFKFNRLLYHFIELFTDKSSNKIYLPLLERFANGINAGEIMKGNAIDDISSNNGIAIFPTREINSKSAIFATLAMAIRNIVTNKKQIGPVTMLNYAEPEFSNISEYMKDLMTAYLPIFDKQLNIICAKCDLFKSLIEQTRISFYKSDAMAAARGFVPGDVEPTTTRPKSDGVADNLRIAVAADNEAAPKSQLLDMLTHISASARSLQKCCNGVYKELSDIPLYFETYKGSISDYKNRNNVLPLMPLSHVSHLLNNQIRLVPGKDFMSFSSDDIHGGKSMITGGAELPELQNKLQNLIKEADRLITILPPGNAFRTPISTAAGSLRTIAMNIETTAIANKTAADLAALSTAINNFELAIYRAKNEVDRLNRRNAEIAYRNIQTYYACKGLIPHSDVGVGSDEFKFAYGTRGLLSDNKEIDIEFAPGVLGVLDTYNSKVGGDASYDKRKMVDCFTYSTHLLRFATDYIYHKTYLGDQDLDKLTSFFIVGTTGISDPAGDPLTLNRRNVLQHLSCQTGRHKRNNADMNNDGIIKSNDEFFINTSNIILLIENDNYKQSVYRLLRCIIDSQLNEHMHFGDRKNLRIYNILDTNIVPINFHALQRELPLINLFNYSYTFEQLVRNRFGIDTRNITPAGDIRNSDWYVNDSYQKHAEDARKAIRTEAIRLGFNDHNVNLIINDFDAQLAAAAAAAAAGGVRGFNIILRNAFNTMTTATLAAAGLGGVAADQLQKIKNAGMQAALKTMDPLYPEDTMVRILMCPQGFRSISNYYGNIWDLMAGKGLNLNKPKYLSDQLWNKVLLNTLYGDVPGPKAGTLGTPGTAPSDMLVRNQGNDSLTKLMGWQSRIQPTAITYQINKSDKHR